MSKRIIIACIWWTVIVAAMAVAGCSQEGVHAQVPAAGGLDAFTNFVPVAGSDYAVGGAGTDIILATSGLEITSERGRKP